MDANTVFVIAVATTRMIMPGMPDMSGVPGMSDMSKPQVTLSMNLTSEKGATKSSKAECAIPAGLKLGPKVDLKIDLPEAYESSDDTPDSDDGPTREQKMVIKYYWMCGEVVAPGQPRILDTEKMMAGLDAMHGGPAQTDRIVRQRIEAQEDGSYAYWPYDGKGAIKDTSQKCPGAYMLTTNYCGGTDITLEKSQDFLAPITLVSPKNNIDLEQTIKIDWDPVPNALAYILTAFGGSENETVFWTSSNDPDVMVDFAYKVILPAQVKQYVEKGILLPPDKTDCRIPAGIFKDCGSPMLNVVAVGTDKIQTKDGIQTQVTVRSTATAILGMPGGMEMDDAGEPDEPVAEETTKQQQKDEPKTSEQADQAEDADGEANKVKDTINRAKDILKW